MHRPGCLLLASLCAVALWADDSVKSSSPNSPPDIPALLKLLADPSFQVREKAIKALEKLDPAFLPELQQAAKEATDPEVQRRLAEIIPVLERARYLAPTRITLSLQNKPLKEVVQAFSSACGYSLELVGGDEREKRLVTLELKDTPFWEALDKLCDLGGLVYQENYYGPTMETLRLEYGEGFPGVVYVSGPFRVSVRGFNHVRNVEFASRPRQSSDPPVRRTEVLTIRLVLTVEPRLPLLSCGQPILTEVIDEHGQPLPFPAQNHMYAGRYYSGYRTISQEVQTNLQPSPGSRWIRLLRGSIPVTVIANQTPRIVIDKVAEAQGKTFEEGNISLKIESIAKNGQQVTFRITLHDGTQQGKRDYSWINQLAQRLVLSDEKGNKWQCYGPSWDGNGFNGGPTFHGTVTYASNNRAGEPYRLTYYEWHTLSHSVDFEFRDLALP